nr:MAG TPA: hypothetical protein [Caudoviricetes sp.]
MRFNNISSIYLFPVYIVYSSGLHKFDISTLERTVQHSSF